jgi:Icc-related predicted phosphoesterase
MGLLRRRDPGSDETVKLFFATDIHGSEVCWRKFVAAAEFYSAEILILGGDFTGKLVIPIVRSQEGRYRAQFMGKEHVLGPEDLARFERRVSDSGFYPRQMDPDEFAELERDPAGVERLFEQLIVERLVAWIRYASERLGRSGVRILTAPANDDPYYIDQTIEEHGGDVFVNVEGHVVELAPGHEMISTGFTNRTPWDTPREHDEDAIAAHINQMAARLEQPASAVFNLHPPPRGTKLDLAPRLDEHLSVVTSAGATVMDHVGSSAVAEALDRHQPLLSLHGHIHESAGQVQIGRTMAINPGSEYGEGVLRGALVRIGGGRVHSYQATSG